MQTVSHKCCCPLMRNVIDSWSRHKNDASKHALTNARRGASIQHARISMRHASVGSLPNATFRKKIKNIFCALGLRVSSSRCRRAACGYILQQYAVRGYSYVKHSKVLRHNVLCPLNGLFYLQILIQCDMNVSKAYVFNISGYLNRQ